MGEPRDHLCKCAYRRDASVTSLIEQRSLVGAVVVFQGPDEQVGREVGMGLDLGGVQGIGGVEGTGQRTYRERGGRPAGEQEMEGAQGNSPRPPAVRAVVRA